MIEAAFVRQFEKGGSKKCPWTSKTLCQIWEYARKARSQDKEAVSLDEYALTCLIIELLKAAPGVKYADSIDESGPPGFCSASVVFHAKNPQAAFKAAIAELKLRLASPR
jgi:hypothetical protein